MAQPLACVNDAEAFLSRFSGPIFIRLINDEYDHNNGEPRWARPRHFYGDLADVLTFLREVATPYNCGGTDQQRFNVFYCVNDPRQGQHAQMDDVAELRAIYQDCDDPDLAAIEQTIAGQEAHAVIESSPGKRQRIWHIDPIEAWRHRALHDHMCARHSHDPSTKGPNRLLRLPGFRNWKYEGGPYATLLTTRDLPNLTKEAVDAHFWPNAGKERNHLDRTMNRAQASGDLPDGAAVYSIEKERAKRSGRLNGDKDATDRERDAHDMSPQHIRTDDLLNMLSLLDPDTHRDEWRKVLAILHFMAGEREWGKELAETWSAQAITRFDPKTFESHWAGVKRTVRNPATLNTLRRMTRSEKHTDTSRAFRQCLAFKRFEEQHGPMLEFEDAHVQWPEQIFVGQGERQQIVPDPRSRRNVEYLLELENTAVYFDEFHHTYMRRDLDGQAFEIDENFLTEVYSTAWANQLRVDKNLLATQIEALAIDKKRDPVLKVLNRMPMWDGVERLSTAFIRLMGAPDRPSVRETLPLVMFGIIRRARQPGCKFDLMPILEGRQGLGKSSFFRILMPDAAWFGEGPKLNEEAKRLLPSLAGKLIVEFAELAGNSKQMVDSIKKLITQQHDEYIANFARKKTRVARRCIFIGTVNNSQYLRDLTDNRRHPIIPVTKELDFAALEAERDQLWAEAIMFEEMHGDLRLSPEAVADMEELQQSRLDVNTEAATIIDELRGFQHAWLHVETIWERIGYPYHERQKRVGQAQYLIKEIQALMEREGWTWNRPMSYQGKTVRGIYRKQCRGEPHRIRLDMTGTFTTEAEPDIEDLLS